MRGRRDWLVIVLGMVAALLLGLALIELVVVYPKFIALYEEMGVQEFPVPTLIFLKVSHALVGKWWVGALLLMGLASAGRLLVRRTAVGQRWWGQIRERRQQIALAAAVSGAVLGLVALPLVWLSLFLPMVSIHAQLAAP
ncbi:MAG: hypothetical protein FJX75_03075 [Armatimonadetes bacterium]|nr:hypothetical protein [Armatimonadota bacterium]